MEPNENQQEALQTSEKGLPKEEKSLGDRLLGALLVIIILCFAWMEWKQYRILNTMLISYETYNQHAKQLTLIPEQLGILEQRIAKNQRVIQVFQEQLEALSKRTSQIFSTDPDVWTLTEAYSLARIAEQKLWLTQDIATATTLLQSSDKLIASIESQKMRDLRQALAQDIAQLKNLTPLDREGLIMRLKAMAQDVTGLSITPMSERTLAADIDRVKPKESDAWQVHLKYNWDTFLERFITVRRHDDIVQAPLSAPQLVLLKENIQSLLIQTQLAVHLGDEAVYQQSLKDIGQGLKLYSYEHNSNLNRIHSEIENIKQLSVVIPETPALTVMPLFTTVIKAQMATTNNHLQG